MSRLMSVAFTEDAVRERRKTVTRRKGWVFLKPGDRLTLCRKVMGRKKGEPLVRICEVEVVDVQRQSLARLHESGSWVSAEMEREGFPDLEGKEFVRRYFVEAQGMSSFEDVTRIEWRYLDEPRDCCDLAPERALCECSDPACIPHHDAEHRPGAPYRCSRCADLAMSTGVCVRHEKRSA